MGKDVNYKKKVFYTHIYIIYIYILSESTSESLFVSYMVEYWDET